MYRTISVTLLLALVPGGETLNIRNSKASIPELSCSVLDNHEVYSSVRVAVGNPPQSFDLVADTGSDNCIVYDCSCKQCPTDWGSCFTGPDHSKSFKMPMFKVDNPYQSRSNFTKAPAQMVMRFGSGDISATIASDEVQIGPLKVYMQNGLLLMVDQALSLTGHFEGILGLGRPQEADPDAGHVPVPGFMERAHVQRFSMCLNHKAEGVLGFNTPSHPNPLKSVGKAHWSLNFHGLTLGQEQVDLGTCSESRCSIIPDSGTTLLVGPEEPILRIYDSLCKSWKRCYKMYEKLQKETYKLKLTSQAVTTESLPEARNFISQNSLPENFTSLVAKLAASSGELLGEEPVAQAVDAEAAAAKIADSLDNPQISLGMTLRVLLEHCVDWMAEVDVNSEMPDLAFHMTDRDGNSEELKISPRSYVVVKTVDVEVPGFSDVFGAQVDTTHTERKQVCVMAFSPASYQTEDDGQIWILGMPLFYEYTAHYDRGNAPEDVTMGFTSRDEEDCGRCDDNVIVRAESLLDEQVTGGIARVGLESLNSLSRAPIIRDLSGIEHL